MLIQMFTDVNASILLVRKDDFLISDLATWMLADYYEFPGEICEKIPDNLTLDKIENAWLVEKASQGKTEICGFMSIGEAIQHYKKAHGY